MIICPRLRQQGLWQQDISARLTPGDHAMWSHEDIKQSLKVARQAVKAGNLRAADKAFIKARRITSSLASTRSIDDCFSLSDDLLHIANEQADAGFWRSAQKTFVAARKAAKKASNVVTRRRERAENIERVGYEEVVAMVRAGQPRAARHAIKRMKKPEKQTAAWMAAAQAAAGVGELEAARTAFAEARALAGQMPDEGIRLYWVSEVASTETEALAKAARSQNKQKGGKKVLAAGATAEFAEKALDGNAEALEAMVDAVRTGNNDEARIAARVLGDASYGDDVDTSITLPGLLDAFTHKDPETREIAAEKIESLIRVKSILSNSEGLQVPGLSEKLIASLADPSPRIRTLAAQGLGWLRGISALDALIQALRPPGLVRRIFSKKKFGPARAAVASALSLLEGDKQKAVLPLIRSARKDPSGEVRQAAMEALRLIGDKRALPVAVALKDDPVTGYAARSLIIDFRDQGRVDEQQMAKIRHGLGDEAFLD
jgi:HEAT repeat protein